MSQLRNVSNIIKNRPWNMLLSTDSYKCGHNVEYIPGCNKVYSYLQARSNKTFNESVFFGLQYYMKNYFMNPVTHADVEEFDTVRTNILGTQTPKSTLQKMHNLADLGYWPLHIKAVKEGSVVPIRNALLTMTNTQDEFYWTVGFVESILLKLWYPITVATTSYEYRKVVDQYFDETASDNLNWLKPFMVHDFGYRGDSSEESAIISGMSHLTSFSGSDTIPAYNGILDYYTHNSNSRFDFMGSVPASEHSVMCSFGRDNELDAYRHMLNTYPTGLVSIVSDTYNIWNVLTNFAAILKDDILNRNGKVVFRPDSGNPEYIICGDPHATDKNSPEAKGCIRLLDEMFGSTVNAKGYKELNPKVGLIYGDGMYLERYKRVLQRLKEMGYSASNLVIGVGGILRYHNRDTLGFAIKATKVEVNGVEKSIMKDPITDSGKRSHQGYLALYKDDNGYRTVDNVTKEIEKTGELETVFKDGILYRDEDLYTIRDRILNIK